MVRQGRTIGMVRERERGHSLDVTRERRERRDEALEAMNNDETIVEEIWMSNLHSSDEDLTGGGGKVSRLGPLGSDGDATACAQGLDLGTESELPEIFDGEEARYNVFPEEVRDGARGACTERGIGGSEESGGTGPGCGNG